MIWFASGLLGFLFQYTNLVWGRNLTQEKIDKFLALCVHEYALEFSIPSTMMTFWVPSFIMIVIYIRMYR